jgi:ATP-dependent DNA helicase RecQ
MYADSFKIDTTTYLKRKQLFEERVNIMIDYTRQTNNCRSQFLADYFNAPISKTCGVCDNCLNEKAIVISKEEFELISTRIIDLLKAGYLTMPDILIQLKDVKKEKSWKVIHYLQSERKISTNREGYISL